MNAFADDGGAWPVVTMHTALSRRNPSEFVKLCKITGFSDHVLGNVRWSQIVGQFGGEVKPVSDHAAKINVYHALLLLSRWEYSSRRLIHHIHGPPGLVGLG